MRAAAAEHQAVSDKRAATLAAELQAVRGAAHRLTEQERDLLFDVPSARHVAPAAGAAGVQPGRTLAAPAAASAPRTSVEDSSEPKGEDVRPPGSGGNGQPAPPTELEQLRKQLAVRLVQAVAGFATGTPHRALASLHGIVQGCLTHHVPVKYAETLAPAASMLRDRCGPMTIHQSRIDVWCRVPTFYRSLVPGSQQAVEAIASSVDSFVRQMWNALRTVAGHEGSTRADHMDAVMPEGHWTAKLFLPAPTPVRPSRRGHLGHRGPDVGRRPT